MRLIPALVLLASAPLVTQRATTQPASGWVRVDPIRPTTRPTAPPAEPIHSYALTGEIIDFPDDYRDKLVLFIFWASWCQECAGEAALWRQTYERYHAAGLEVLGFACDKRTHGPMENALGYIETHQIPWPNIFDDASDIARDYHVDALPKLFLIDGSSGRIISQGDWLRGEGLARQVAARLRMMGRVPGSQPTSSAGSK